MLRVYPTHSIPSHSRPPRLAPPPKRQIHMNPSNAHETGRQFDVHGTDSYEFGEGARESGAAAPDVGCVA